MNQSNKCIKPLTKSEEHHESELASRYNSVLEKELESFKNSLRAWNNAMRIEDEEGVLKAKLQLERAYAGSHTICELILMRGGDEKSAELCEKVSKLTIALAKSKYHMPEQYRKKEYQPCEPSDLIDIKNSSDNDDMYA